MKEIESIVFDLDGTIVDSKSTIYKSVADSLKELNIEFNVSEEKFSGMIGHHFKDIFNEFSITVPDLQVFYENYKSFYFDYIDASKLYPGVIELLDFLVSRGIKISLLTTKLQSQADLISEHFKLTAYFSIIMGRRQNMEIKPSPQPLLEICRALNVSPARTLMVGDTEMDVQCGRSAGSFTCAVSFGYRTEDELNRENPDILIHEFSELRKYFQE